MGWDSCEQGNEKEQSFHGKWFAYGNLTALVKEVNQPGIRLFKLHLEFVCATSPSVKHSHHLILLLIAPYLRLSFYEVLVIGEAVHSRVDEPTEKLTKLKINRKFPLLSLGWFFRLRWDWDLLDQHSSLNKSAISCGELVEIMAGLSILEWTTHQFHCPGRQSSRIDPVK